MLPDSYEQELIEMQFKKWTSLFACNGYAVYSNRVMSLGKGLDTRLVNSTLKCDNGGST